MKKIQDIIDKYGWDKFMHFFVAAWIVSMFSPLGWGWVIGATVFTAAVTFIKEKYLDDPFELADIIWSLCGCAASIIIYGILSIFL